MTTKLIFDIDGVLIDTRKSYIVAIQKTVEYFYKQNIDISLVEQLKRNEGFNNDWYASYVLTNCLLLKIELDHYQRITNENEIYSYEVVKNVFQSIYLGPERYPVTIEDLKETEGLWKKEALIFTKKELMSLADKYGKLSIITGRTKDEAEYALNYFNIFDLFSDVISVEDIHDGYFSAFPQYKEYGVDKSNPVLLFQIPDIKTYPKLVYIGDNVSDMILVYNSRDTLPVKGINFLYDNTEEEIQKMKSKTVKYMPDFLAVSKQDVFDILTVSV